MSAGYENISVVMPVRNGEFFLENILQEIVRMVENHDEIIVINDGSTDSTGKILEKWASQSSKIKLVTTSGVGLVAALNLGIEKAENNWIARFDVDDVYSSDRLAIQRMMIADDVGAIFCDYSLNIEGKKVIGVIPNAFFPEAISVSLIHSQRTPHPSALLNKEKVLAVGGYREVDFPAEDISLWLRLSHISKLVGIPSELLNYRISRYSISGANQKLAAYNTKKVIIEFSIPSEDIDYCIINWKKIFNQYNVLTYSSERKILFLYDLSAALKSKKQGNWVLLVILLKLIFEWKSYHAIFNLVRLKFLKKIYNLFPNTLNS